MSDFSDRLRNLSARLQIPEPTRSRVLLEVATDMEDLLHHYLEEGVARPDAIRLVEERFNPSDDALRELVEVHNSPMQRSLEALSSQLRSRWERVLLSLIALAVALGLVSHLLQPSLFRDASPLAYFLLVTLAVALGLGLWEARVLFRSERSRRVPIPRSRIRSLPGLGLLLLGVGFGGVWLDLYRAALSIRGDPGSALPSLVRWLHMASATMVVALAGALLTGFLWFFLEARAGALEEEAAAGFLEPSQ